MRKTNKRENLLHKINYRGSGFLDTLSNLASGKVATAIKNLIPSSDPNARSQFVGEHHMPLVLPNGKYGIANYAGQMA